MSKPRYKPIGIKVILEYELTDMWLDEESFGDDPDYWTDERIIELLDEDINTVFEEGTWRVERGARR